MDLLLTNTCTCNAKIHPNVFFFFQAHINLSQCSSERQTEGGSKISSWSVDQNEFEKLNEYLESCSISPVKFKVHTSLDELADSSKRYIRKKATEAVGAVLNT